MRLWPVPSAVCPRPVVPGAAPAVAAAVRSARLPRRCFDQRPAAAGGQRTAGAPPRVSALPAALQPPPDPTAPPDSAPDERAASPRPQTLQQTLPVKQRSFHSNSCLKKKNWYNKRRDSMWNKETKEWIQKRDKADETIKGNVSLDDRTGHLLNNCSNIATAVILPEKWNSDMVVSEPLLLMVFQPVEVDCRAAPRRAAQRPLLIGSWGTWSCKWRTERGRQGPPPSTLRQLEGRTADRQNRTNTDLKQQKHIIRMWNPLIHCSSFGDSLRDQSRLIYTHLCCLKYFKALTDCEDTTPTEEEQQRDENQQQSERKPAGRQTTATRLIKAKLLQPQFGFKSDAEQKKSSVERPSHTQGFYRVRKMLAVMWCHRLLSHLYTSAAVAPKHTHTHTHTLNIPFHIPFHNH